MQPPAFFPTLLYGPCFHFDDIDGVLFRQLADTAFLDATMRQAIRRTPCGAIELLRRLIANRRHILLPFHTREPEIPDLCHLDT